MTDKQLDRVATMIRLWTSHLRRSRQSVVSMTITAEYMQGKVDAAWQMIDILLSEEEIQKIEALTGEKR